MAGGGGRCDPHTPPVTCPNGAVPAGGPCALSSPRRQTATAAPRKKPSCFTPACTGRWTPPRPPQAALAAATGSSPREAHGTKKKNPGGGGGSRRGRGQRHKKRSPPPPPPYSGKKRSLLHCTPVKPLREGRQDGRKPQRARPTHYAAPLHGARWLAESPRRTVRPDGRSLPPPPPRGGHAAGAGGAGEERRSGTAAVEGGDVEDGTKAGRRYASKCPDQPYHHPPSPLPPLFPPQNPLARAHRRGGR